MYAVVWFTFLNMVTVNLNKSETRSCSQTLCFKINWKKGVGGGGGVQKNSQNHKLPTIYKLGIKWKIITVIIHTWYRYLSYKMIVPGASGCYEQINFVSMCQQTIAFISQIVQKKTFNWCQSEKMKVLFHFKQTTAFFPTAVQKHVYIFLHADQTTWWILHVSLEPKRE